MPYNGVRLKLFTLNLRGHKGIFLPSLDRTWDLQEVRALIYSEPSGGEALKIVQLNKYDGVWSVNGPIRWEECYSVYEVSFCIPPPGGLKSVLQITHMPDDEKPEITDFSDISIYELHIKDFSANDPTVDPEVRGILPSPLRTRMVCFI